MKTIKLAWWALALGGMALSLPASADYSWTFSSSCSGASSTLPSPLPYGNVVTCSGSSGAPAVTATAWANTASNSSTTNPPVSSGNIANAYLAVYDGGLGVTNRDRTSSAGDPGEPTSPEHAVDNNQRYDSVLFKFAESVALNSFTVGWKSTDSDVTVLRYIGSLTPGSGAPDDFTGKTYTQLTAAGGGWELIGHYANAPVGAGTSLGNTTNKTSSYWLVGAYNPAVGGSCSPATCDAGNDYIKLLALSATTPSGGGGGGGGGGGSGGGGSGVPEPNTMILLGVAMLALLKVRKTRRV